MAVENSINYFDLASGDDKPSRYMGRFFPA